MSTKTLSVYGDSAMDVRNVYEVAVAAKRPNPFESYKAETRPSDGKVLSQYFAEDINWDGVKQFNINIVSALGIKAGLARRSLDFDNAVVNFAYAGASSGPNGSATSETNLLPFGFLSQADTASGFFSGDSQGRDAVINVGTNDIFDALNNLDSNTDFLNTRGLKDDKKWASEVAKEVVRNIKEGYRIIDDFTEDTVIYGLIQPSEIPRASDQIEKNYDNIIQGGVVLDQFLAKKVNKKLVKGFKDDSDVYVVDSFSAWKRLDDPSFLSDGIHPDTETYSMLAEITADQAIEKLGIGFG